MAIDWFNFVEAWVWIGLGTWGLFQKSFEKTALAYCLAVILVCFGVSDFVEMTTGCWWHPWWLLAWKAACLITAITLIMIIIKKERRTQ